AAVAEIRAAGGEAHGIAADVADKDAAAAIAGQAAALVGPIDLLVNNASTLGPVPLRLLLDTDCEDLERALAVNLVGAFRLTKAIAGPMVLRGAGTIVNVTSDAATEAYERWGAYGASKAALEQLGRVWAAELAGTGVRLYTVDPGEMDTRMHADAIPEADRAELSDPARVADRLLAWWPARTRMPQPPPRAPASPSAWDRKAPRRCDEAGAHLPPPARRRPAAGDRSRRAGGVRPARDANAGAPRPPRAGRPAGGQRCRHPPRLASRHRRGRPRARGAPRRRPRRRTLCRRSFRCRRLAHTHRGPPRPAGDRPGGAGAVRRARRHAWAPGGAVAAAGGAALRSRRR